MYGSDCMRQQCLIDLFVHSSTGTVEEIADVTSNEGVDAVCYVVDSADELPDREIFEQASERGRTNIFPGFEIMVSGCRWLVLLPAWDEAPWEVLEALGDTQLLAEAVA